jgi:hypothetical protein
VVLYRENKGFGAEIYKAASFSPPHQENRHGQGSEKEQPRSQETEEGEGRSSGEILHHAAIGPVGPAEDGRRGVDAGLTAVQFTWRSQNLPGRRST